MMKLAQRYGRATRVAALAAASLVTINGCASYADWRDENKGIQLEALKTAPGLKVSAKAFGSGRRIPIAQRTPL